MYFSIMMLVVQTSIMCMTTASTDEGGESNGAIMVWQIYPPPHSMEEVIPLSIYYRMYLRLNCSVQRVMQHRGVWSFVTAAVVVSG